MHHWVERLFQTGSWCLIVATFLSGCGGASDAPKLGQVRGVVNLNGQPLAKANVEFRPAEGGRPSTGITDEAGKYELYYTADAKGAKIGPHSVLITTFTYETPNVPEKLPEIYHAKTTLKADVQPGPNELNFDLKSK